MCDINHLINEIESYSDESAIAVCESLCMAYDKAILIQENCDYNAEDIYVIMEATKEVDEPFWKRLLLLIPRLIMSFFSQLRRLIVGNKKKNTKVPDKANKNVVDLLSDGLIISGTASLALMGENMLGSVIGKHIANIMNHIKGRSYERFDKDFKSVKENIEYRTNHEIWKNNIFYDNYTKKTNADNKMFLYIDRNGNIHVISIYDVFGWISDTKKYFDNFNRETRNKSMFDKINGKTKAHNKSEYEKYISTLVYDLLQKTDEYRPRIESYIASSAPKSKYGGKEGFRYTPSELTKKIDETINEFSSTDFEKKLRDGLYEYMVEISNIGKEMIVTDSNNDPKTNKNGTYKTKNMTTKFSTEEINKYFVMLTNHLTSTIRETIDCLYYIQGIISEHYKTVGDIAKNPEKLKELSTNDDGKSEDGSNDENQNNND